MPTLALTKKSIDVFCEYLLARGRKGETIDAYRRNLLVLFSFLPEEKTLTEDSINGYIVWLKEQYTSARTIKMFFSGLNGVLQYVGHKGTFFAEMIKLEERDCERFPEAEQPVYGWELKSKERARL